MSCPGIVCASPLPGLVSQAPLNKAARCLFHKSYTSSESLKMHAQSGRPQLEHQAEFHDCTSLLHANVSLRSPRRLGTDLRPSTCGGGRCQPLGDAPQTALETSLYQHYNGCDNLSSAKRTL